MQGRYARLVAANWWLRHDDYHSSVRVCCARVASIRFTSNSRGPNSRASTVEACNQASRRGCCSRLSLGLSLNLNLHHKKHKGNNNDTSSFCSLADQTRTWNCNSSERARSFVIILHSRFASDAIVLPRPQLARRASKLRLWPRKADTQSARLPIQGETRIYLSHYATNKMINKEFESQNSPDLNKFTCHPVLLLLSLCSRLAERRPYDSTQLP